METLLNIRDLSVSFKTDEGIVHAVDGVSLTINKGEVLGLVGESGCGKSVTSMSILRLLPTPPGSIDSGEITFDNKNLLSIQIEELRKIRGKSISMIFQEPMTALSPLHSVGNQLVETLQFHSKINYKEAWRIGEQWLDKTGISDPKKNMHAYPFQLSGGMCQRVMIAMALMLDPKLIIADEPTTALDVTIQAQVFDLMREMKKKDTSMMLITHNMGIIWEMCDRVAVMYASEIVEVGTVTGIFKKPLHPYTEALLNSIPLINTGGKYKKLESIPGQVPSALNYPKGCRFQDRCKYVFDRCYREHPSLYNIDGKQARCFLAEDRNK
jgi:peptide/nickel transport system ATP-binding protein/oligopeptide transport system ATP-binding protein